MHARRACSKFRRMPAAPSPAAHHVRHEIANALTHGLGAAAALAGGAVLITLAAIYGDGWQLAGAIVTVAPAA